MKTSMDTDTYTVALAEEARVEMTAEQIRAAYIAGSLTRRTLIWRDGMEEWDRLENLAEELGISLRKATPPPHPGMTETERATRETFVERRVYVEVQRRLPKSRATYIMGGLCFGWLGLHNFYAGYYAGAIFQLFFTLVLASTFWPLLLIMFIVNVSEVICTTLDGWGQKMTW